MRLIVRMIVIGRKKITIIKSEIMSKDLGCKWNFIVRNEASQEQGREYSSFDYFKEKERCFVREYIQNSMDAYSEKSGYPYVRVEFSFGELACSEYPELIQ